MVTVVHVGVVIFIIIAGLTQAKGENFTQGGCAVTFVAGFHGRVSLIADIA